MKGSPANHQVYGALVTELIHQVHSLMLACGAVPEPQQAKAKAVIPREKRRCRPFVFAPFLFLCSAASERLELMEKGLTVGRSVQAREIYTRVCASIVWRAAGGGWSSLGSWHGC